MDETRLFHFQGDPRDLHWYTRPNRHIVPYCKKHHLFIAEPSPYDHYLSCDDHDEPFQMKRNFEDQLDYIARKIDGKTISRLRAVRVDVEGATVLAKEVTLFENDQYFVRGKLTDTEGGVQLMILAGMRDGTDKKVQLFVEPGTKRLNFDRNSSDQHPSGIFTEVTARFKDSSITISDETGNKPSK